MHFSAMEYHRNVHNQPINVFTGVWRNLDMSGFYYA